MTESFFEGKAERITESLRAGTATGDEATQHAFLFLAAANQLASPLLEEAWPENDALDSRYIAFDDAVMATTMLKSILPLFERYPLQSQVIEQQITITHAAIAGAGMEKITYQAHEAHKRAGRFDEFSNVVDMVRFSASQKAGGDHEPVA